MINIKMLFNFITDLHLSDQRDVSELTKFIYLITTGVYLLFYNGRYRYSYPSYAGKTSDNL